MKAFLVILVFLLLPSIAISGEIPISKILIANNVRLLAQDWGQTKDFRANRPDMYEINAMLGKYPSLDKVDIYMGACTIIYVVSALELSEKYSIALSALVSGIEAWAVSNNKRLNVNPEYDRRNGRASMIIITIPF